MRKRTYICFTALCLALSASLALGFLIKGPSAGGANERMQAKPAPFTEEGRLNSDFLSELSGYFNQRFYLRQELISVHNRLVTGLSGSSPQKDVLVGRDGWLYYAPTLDVYTGIGGMSDEQLDAAAENLKKIQDCCDSLGVKFLFTVAPNKNSLYAAAMPEYPGADGPSDTERLYERLELLGVSYLDLHALFRAEDQVLYFAHDSHWNSKGAALAADGILSSLGIDSAYYSDGFSKSVSHNGDLYGMLYPAFADPETDPVYGGALRCEYDGPSKADSIRLKTSGDGDGSLLCYRDSFGNLLHPYLADSFARADFSRSTDYDLSAAGDYDCLVIELVERNLRYLTENSPIIPEDN